MAAATSCCADDPVALAHGGAQSGKRRRVRIATLPGVTEEIWRG